MLFQPSRDQVRQFFCEAWAKQRAQTLLSALETMAVDWILEHPEYHALLEQPEQASREDFSVERGQVNPFLHLSMHLAIAEQVSIDQPPGIRNAFERLARTHDSLHEAAHRLMDCLGQTLHEAQVRQTAPDHERYLECIERAQSK
jgi:hypothetical protein